MIYLGNFSYNDELDSTDNYCLMPCIVEADSTDHALELFSEHLIEVAKTSDLLDGAKEIFLDSIVELGEVPTTPLIAQWQKIMPAGVGLCSITSALPTLDLDDETANAYGFNEHSHDHEEDEEEHEHEEFGNINDLDDELLEELGQDEEPFLRF